MTTIDSTAPVQELLLADDLFPGLHLQAKLVTIRARHRDLALGELVFRGATDSSITTKVTVSHVEHTTLGQVSDEDARADGYLDVREMVHLMKRFYPDINVTSPVTVLRFTLAPSLDLAAEQAVLLGTFAPETARASGPRP